MKTETLFESLIQKSKSLISWTFNLDWTNPRIVLTGLLMLMLPFVAGYYIVTGLILGMLLAVAMLFLIDKSPRKLKEFCLKYPLISDLFLSSFSVMTLGGYFGSGLTLGLGAVFCAVFLSLSLPHIKLEEIQPAMA